MRRPTRARHALGLLAAGALLLALAGCGEKGEPETTGPVVAQSTSPVTGSTVSTTTSTTPVDNDRAQATTAALAFLTSSDAATVCDEGITPEMLKQTYGNREGCLAARKSPSLAKNAEVQGFEIRGQTATVTLRVDGGEFGNGGTIKLVLVGDGAGTWRVSRVIA